MLARILPSPPALSLPEPPKAQSISENAPIVVHNIDFPALGFPQYKGRFAMVIDNLFTEQDCAKLLDAAEASGPWEVAQVNGGNVQYTDTSYRNSSRIMLDDHDLAAWILSKLRPYLGEIEATSDAGQLSRLNERLRFLKYGEGQFFKPHCDGTYITPDETEISYYTLQIYLNGDAKSLKGGATRFWGSGAAKARNKTNLDVEARTGRVLVFEQARLLHSGQPVSKGVKICMRTDFMYIHAEN